MPMSSPLLNWSAWRPLSACWVERELALSGLYRIRRAGCDELDYIGQTGLRLRDRLGMLKGIYGSEMPYRDPHTVAPALWAQWHVGGEDYEASTCPVEGDARRQKALECVAIALYRQEHRRSPTFNFGRMPVGYRMSSPNNARVAAASKRFRGGRMDASDSSHLPSICPVGSLDADGCADTWCGHAWSRWMALASAGADPGATGVYRIRGGNDQIVYIGEGMIAARLAAHRTSARAATSPQGRALAAAQPLSCSWVANAEWADHQRLELENDLLAATVLANGSPPLAQFYALSARRERGADRA
jgi:hypothetical protein